MTAIPEHIMEEAQDVAFDCDPTKTSDQIANTIALALLAAEKRGREEERERCEIEMADLQRDSERSGQ